MSSLLVVLVLLASSELPAGCRSEDAATDAIAACLADAATRADAEAAARAGNVELALRLAREREADGDTAAARLWYETAAIAGDAGAMTALAASHAAGGDCASARLAHLWYDSAARAARNATVAEDARARAARAWPAHCGPREANIAGRSR